MLEFFVNFITGGAGTKCSLFDVRKGHRSDNLVGEIRIKQKEALYSAVKRDWINALV